MSEHMWHGEPTGYFTADGAPIVIGMAVFDNNCDRVTVGRFLFDENGAGWFDTIRADGRTSGMADGSRMGTRHPGTGERAEPATPAMPADDATVPATPAVQLTRREAAGVHRSGLSRMAGTVQRVEYAHGIVVTFERMPAPDDVNGYSADQRWYYGVWTEHGAECEESGYAATRAEAAEYARTARESLSYRH